jgi:hypothetical protein
VSKPGPMRIDNWTPQPEWKSYLGTPTGAFLEYDPALDKVHHWGRFPQLLP